MSVIGVKYTTARAVGARAAALAARRLGRSTRRTNTDTAILPGAGISDHEALTIETARAVGLELAPSIIKHLNAIYGDRSAAIVRLMAERSDWRMPLVPGRPNVGAEVIHAIRDEMACTLADIVIRRSELGAAGHTRGKNSSPPARGSPRKNSAGDRRGDATDRGGQRVLPAIWKSETWKCRNPARFPNSRCPDFQIT